MERSKFYFVGSKIPVDEDLTNEFKGHTNFTKEQVPPFANDPMYNRPTRQPISKTINAFLNSPRGGTIYMGITDEGRILGILLNQYKMDHIAQNLNDVMNRYSPHVKSHRYDLRFVPVLHDKATEEDIENALSFDPSVGVDSNTRINAHSLRSYRFCWCDKYIAAQINSGVLCMQYVIEIHIKPWDPSDVFNAGLGVGLMNAQPIHENEEGKVYYRGGACIREFTVSELQSLASKIVLDHYQAIEEKLKNERSDLIRRLPSIVEKSPAN